jgi:hypothetical protein
MLNTKMNGADGDVTVTRVEVPDHFATEEDATHLYVSKEAQKMANTLKDGLGDIYTSLQPRIRLPHVPDESVLNLSRVATTTSAALIERQRALAQLKRMAANDNYCAVTILAYLKEVAPAMLKSLE